MAAARYHLLNGIQIPRGLRWDDEFGDEWSPVSRVAEYSISGALLVDVNVRQAGRPITLKSIGEDQGHILKRTLQQLYDLAATPSDAPMTLVLADGRTFEVAFAAGDNPITATPVGYPEVPGPDNRYTATVRLMEL